MKQLELFEREEQKIIDKDRIDISTLPEDPYRTGDKGKPYSDIIPNKYFLFKNGGYHFYEDYKENGKIYPYITNETYFKKGKKVSIVKPFVSFSDPYPKVNLTTIDNKNVIVKMHRIIAFAFIKKPKDDAYVIVNHIDGNIINYKIDNLEWCTKSDNVRNSKKNISKQLELTTLLNKGK